MASIPPALLTPALDAAMQVTTVVEDTFTGAPIVLPSSGADGAGFAVLLISGAADAIDIRGQLAERSWRIVTALRNDTAGRDVAEWVRA